MPEPVVSILTPFKNTEKFLPECLDSILNQTFKNWELLIVDDHSTDKSFKIVQNYAENDNRIKLLKNEGKGIISALRTAFKASVGTYITRMDSDDIMVANKLESMHNDLQIHGKAHIALGLVKYFNENGVNDGYLKYQNWLNRLTNTGSNYSEIYKECVIPSPCWMIHRQDLTACGAFQPDYYPEDYDLTFRFYEKRIKCIPSNNLLHHWRDYPTRTSRTHEHYAQNYFLDIKFKYFLKLDFYQNRPLTVWGAGSKGKTIAQKLVDQGINFSWICDNPKKIGKEIYGVKLQPFDELKNLNKPQSIVTVANEEAQNEIKTYFENQNMKPMLDYFFFC